MKMKKTIILVLLNLIVFSVGFSSYLNDAEKLKDLTKTVVGNISFDGWESSLKAAKKIYTWTKTHISYDYEKDKKILNDSEYSIRSPYQTFLDRKGNSFEISLLNYILLYNTGLFNNINKISFSESIGGGLISVSDDVIFKCTKDEYKKDLEDIKSYIKVGKLKELSYHLSKKLKDCGYEDLANEIKKYADSIPKDKINRRLYFGTIVFENTDKIKAFVAFDTYLEPYCSYGLYFFKSSYADAGAGNYSKFNCGNSKTLMILDPEFGIYTLPNYVKMLNSKYKRKAIYSVLYSLNPNNGAFNQIYLITCLLQYLL